MDTTTLSLYVNGVFVQQWTTIIVKDDSGDLLRDDSSQQVSSQ